MSVRNLLKIQCNVMNLCLTVTNDNNGKTYGVKQLQEDT